MTTEDTTVATEGSVGSIEERAARMGWSPEEEFRGDPRHWVDAKTFVERADNHLPIMKGTLSTMEKKMVAQEREIARQTKMLQEQLDEVAAVKGTLKEFVEYSRKGEERAYQRALAELKAKQRQAVAEGDTDSFDRVSGDIDDLLKDHPALTGEKPAKLADTVKSTEVKPADTWTDEEAQDEWLDQNEWYFEYPNMAAYAGRMDKKLAKAEPTLTHRERLAKIADAVKEKYPSYFSSTDVDEGEPAAKASGPKRRPGGVEGGSGAPVKNGKRSYHDLPSDAKAACDRFVRDIPGYTKEEYLANYDWS